MDKPSSKSIDLAEGMMDEANPLFMYVAVIIGRTMELNYNCVKDVLNEFREEFVSAGKGEAFKKLEGQLDEVFLDFFNEEEK